MSGLLIHGLYDSKTLETLIGKNIKEFSFDLRPKSFNLITTSELTKLLKIFSTERIFLTFENEQVETIDSYLNLLKDFPLSLTLIFRDAKPSHYYETLGHQFYWMFDAKADWRSILQCKNLSGIFLPLKDRPYFHQHPELWDIIERRNLDVYLHAESFSEALFVNLSSDIKISIDLTGEVETSYRKVDLQKLNNMKIWERINEITPL